MVLSVRAVAFRLSAFCAPKTRKAFLKTSSYNWVQYRTIARKMVFERLPASVRPVNYKLRLQPDLEKLTFEGQEEIQLEVKEATNKVIVNAREIIISEAVFSGGGEDITPEVEYNADEEKAVFTLTDTVKPGTYSLKFCFTGILNDELRGFYRTRYTTPDKVERNGASTHFEATGARRAFPCFDEPAIRATFDITLVVPKDRIALSNMPVQLEESLAVGSGPELKAVEFQRTPIMPTYLVAFVVGEFDIASCEDEDGVQIRVYTPRKKGEQGIYAAEVARDTLPFYKKYFNVPYNLPKLDLVAAPDFPIGAMENWGLVIYREAALLVDSQETSSYMKEYVALIVGHELAHNWFGNLVTMNWWTHLWLKEGFASWIEYLCVDHCFPQYDIWTQFVSYDLGSALKLDALDNSHPIEIEVGNPAQVDEIFDTISYCKGASIINMLHDYIGDDDFRKGLTLYLKRHQYSSACTEDLWRALEEASGKPVGVMMATWTSQKGFPVLMVTEKQTGSQERVLEITQEKFSATVGAQSGDSSLWTVPITITTSSGDVRKVLMDTRKLTVTLTAGDKDWVKVNAGSKGVYRVHYSADMLDRLKPCVRRHLLPPTDRLAIISDLFAQCQAGMVTACDLLNMVEACRGETNFTVWKDLLANLADMGRVLQCTEAHPHFQKFLCGLLGKVYSTVGWEDTEPGCKDHLISKLRELVITTLGVNGEQSVAEASYSAFLDHVAGRRPITSDLRRAVYKTVMRRGDMKDYLKLKEMLIGADSPEEKRVVSEALGYSPDPETVKDVLKFSVSSHVRSQDSPALFASLSTGSPTGRECAWEFFKDNYEMLYQRYSSSTLLARLVKVTTENFVTEAKAVEIENFFREHPAPSAERTVQQSCEKIRLNAKWLNREAENIASYLRERPVPVPADDGHDERKPTASVIPKKRGDGQSKVIVIETAA